MENGEVWISSQDSENLFRECMNNCLHPCIIPVTQSGEIYDEQTPVLDAETLQPIDFDVQEDFVPPIMTKYELHTRAINEIALYLMDRGCSNIATCDIMSISPSIFFNDEDGNHSYIVVRSLPAGLDGISYSFNKSVIDYHKDDKGYIVMKAACRDNSATLFWHLDNEYIGQTTNNHQLIASPNTGKHTLTLVDEHGNQKTILFSVK